MKLVRLPHLFSFWSQCCLNLNHLRTKNTHGLFTNVLLQINGSSCQVLISSVIENEKICGIFLQGSDLGRWIEEERASCFQKVKIFVLISYLCSSKEWICMFSSALFTSSLVVLWCTQTWAQSSDTHGVREIDGERKPVELETEWQTSAYQKSSGEDLCLGLRSCYLTHLSHEISFSTRTFAFDFF